MDTGVLIPIIVLVVLIALFALYLLSTRSALIALRQRVDEAWRDITQQLQRRADLIPDLTQAVQGYATHEPTVFQSVSDARVATLDATTPSEATVAENRLRQAMKSVFTVAEAYPQLMASQRFLSLQGDVADTEDKIQASRRFYNGGVREFNTKIQVFPNTLFARRMGFTPREFFEVADGPAVAQPPRIQF